MAHRPDTPVPLGLAAALVPVVALVGLLGLSFFLFGDAAASGPNQVALVFCSILAIAVAWRHGHSIDDLRDAAVASVTAGLPAIFILLSVGALIGTWALSGTLIAMVYYGLQLLSPDYFYPTACLICLVVAVSIGSSWTVAGTLGIGLMGVAREMGLDPAVTAGAVISGAYFGDKLSPLSGTANLACAAAGSDLYEHFGESLRTSVPSLALALVLFWSLGSAGGVRRRRRDGAHRGRLPALARSTSLPLALVLALALMRWPPFVAIFLGALAGGVLAVVDAPDGSPPSPGADLPARPRAPQGRLGDALRRLRLDHRRARHRPAALAGRHGEHARHRLAHPRGARLRRLHRAGRGAGAPDRPADRRGALGRRAGRDPRRRRLRHQPARLGPVHRRRAAGTHVPSAPSRRAGSRRSCCRAPSATPPP